MVPELSGICYGERIGTFNLPTLVEREKETKKGGKITPHDILEGQSDLNIRQFFEIIREFRTKGHNWKLGKSSVVRDVRKHFLSNGITWPREGKCIGPSSLEQVDNKMPKLNHTHTYTGGS